MTWMKRKRFWLGGCVGLALAVSAPTDAGATGRGGERFDRSGSVFDRSGEGASTWRRNGPGGWGSRPDARAGRGAPGAIPREVARNEDGGGSADPEAPEPTAALLFGAGLIAIRAAVRKGPAR